MRLKAKFGQMCKDTLLICAGLLVMALGSALVYQAALGTGSIGTMVDGVHQALGISRGLADITVSLVLLAVVCLTARDLINIGTVISLFFTGFSIDFWKWVLTFLPAPSAAGVYAMYAAGLVLGSMGTGFYIAVNAGISAYDAFIMTVYRLTRWQYRYAKILADFLLMLAGILLGGTIGVGTVISTVAGGFLTQFFIQRSTRLLGRRAVLTN